jgi:hypothetical protein
MNFTNFTLSTFLAAVVVTSAVAVPPPKGHDTDKILDAIRVTETGGEKDPANAVGDGGKAIGPFQIHYSYWKDAVEFDTSIGGKYSDCKNEAYARKIIVAYWTRYAPNWSFETLSRTHNGGPKGSKKSSTLDYWSKVRKNLA